MNKRSKGKDDVTISILSETKKLHQSIKENEDKFISGEMDVIESLRKSNALYEQLDIQKVTPSECMDDACIVSRYAHIIKQKARSLQPNTRHFNPCEFANKLQRYLLRGASESSNESDDVVSPWLKLGEMAKIQICSTPTFDYLYGTFEPGELEIKKRKRKIREKEVFGKSTPPKTRNMNELKDEEDQTSIHFQWVYSELKRYFKRNPQADDILYFNFVVDPKSFSKTIENMFAIAYLIKSELVEVSYNEENLPIIKLHEESEGNNSNSVAPKKQAALRLTKEKWQQSIETFGITSALIRHRKS